MNTYCCLSIWPILIVILLCCAITQLTVEARFVKMSDVVGEHAHCISVKRDHHHHPPPPEREEEEEEFTFEHQVQSERHEKNSTRIGYKIGSNKVSYGSPSSCADECGNFDVAHGQQYIYGGRDTMTGEIPSHIFVQGGQYLVGGALLSEWLVITAAHNILNRPVDEYLIHAGSNLWYGTPDPDRQTRRIAQVCYPSNLHSGGDQLLNNIAIIKVDKPFELNSLVKRVCWPFERRGEIDTESNDSQCYVTGFGIWGYNNFKDGSVRDKGPPSVLQKMRVKVVPCSAENVTEVKERDMCLRSIPAYSAVTCPGDCGGGVICKDKDNRFTLVGVLTHNFDLGRARTGKPTLCMPQDHRTIANRMYPDEKFNRALLLECSV